MTRAGGGRLRRVVARSLVATAALTAAVALPAAPAAAEGEMAVVELRPGDNFTRTFDSVNAPDYASALHTPEDCRNDAATCDVIRLKLERDPDPEALNFVRVELNWDGLYQPPDLSLVAAGLGLAPVNDLDMYVYDSTGQALEGAGGASAAHNEVAGIVATDDVYDIVVSQYSGVNTEYTMTFIFSNELFVPPFEQLDPALGGRAPDEDGLTAPDDSSGAGGAPFGFPVGDDFAGLGPTDFGPGLTGPGFAGGVLPPVAQDADFAGFRGGIDDNLAGGPLIATPTTDRISRAPAPSPSSVAFWLFFVPAALVGAAVVAFRRRRPAALA